MNRKYINPILALTFFSFLSILFFFILNKSEEASQSVQAQHPPFLTYITGPGIVEPQSGNIVISPPFDRRVEKIHISVNERVKKGEILFTLYDHDLRANLNIRQKRYEEAVTNLCKLRALPRGEDLDIAQENLNKAQAVFQAASIEYCMAKRLTCNKGKKCALFYKYQQSIAEFREAQAQFRKVQSGTWVPELQMAQEAVEQARADVEAMEVELERTLIRSPIDGTVLLIKIHEGEMANQNKTAMILGNIDELNLRVSIDRFNKLKLSPNGPAVAYKIGDTTTEFPLTWIYMEPLMIPKKYLTNELDEKVDTQVFEILYRIQPTPSQLFIGEQMDVYIYVDEGG